VAVSFVLAGVTYTYPRAASPALCDVSLTIPAGQTTAVLGPSGSGKTTLLSLLGLLWEGRLDAGSITYQRGDGKACAFAALTSRERARLRLEEFGFVLQSSYLLPHFTCAQNIAMPLALQGIGARERADRVTRLLELADPKRKLLEAKDRLAGEVAGGQQQRMAVLRAIIHNPRVVLADEPFSNLDPVNARHVLRLLLDWRAGKLHPDANPQERTLVLVCHHLETARLIGDHFVLLDEHRLVGQPFMQAEWPDRASDLERLFAPPTLEAGPGGS
jgi:ABC-type lipoprotein export system ATPase subunit